MKSGTQPARSQCARRWKPCPAYKDSGMECRYRYLRWLDKYERREGEESPLGLILCAEKTAEHVELLQLETSGVRVAEYLTELLPRRVLEAKLHEAIHLAREQIAAREVPRLEGAK